MSGLLFVWGEPGPQVDEEEFNDWYDNEHAPARLTVPGFVNALRYKATDGKTPAWLAIYDLTSPEIATSEPYKALATTASDRERGLIPRFQTLNRRIYELIYQQSNPTTASSDPSKFILVVGLDVNDPSDEDDVNKWYNDEHIPDISKTPGWIRSRRYKLQSSVELSANKDSTPHAYQYLAFHEFDNDQYPSHPAFIAATSTPARERYRLKTKLEIRTVTLYKQF
ncbi:hypothetical protein CVT24_012819 [Panaeolus cyanescens]|uniref:EthD domain-containing protein n=1 Tax=Panaeolus cyanescens TaxID=181874 RepID=A0A409YJS5_9AGAR|nr:hypothetical protein CVT24_012819 [Panaeolus cyanescens]